jgi:hypothetical protein
MSIQVSEEGDSLIIKNGTKERFIIKSHVREINIVRSSILRIDVGDPLKNVYLDRTLVTFPESSSDANLREKIFFMLKLQPEGGGGGGSTDVSGLQSQLEELNAKQFYEPTFIDQTEANTIYRGYAAVGKYDPFEECWAIQRIRVYVVISPQKRT